MSEEWDTANKILSKPLKNLYLSIIAKFDAESQLTSRYCLTICLLISFVREA